VLVALWLFSTHPVLTTEPLTRCPVICRMQASTLQWRRLRTCSSPAPWWSRCGCMATALRAALWRWQCLQRSPSWPGRQAGASAAPTRCAAVHICNAAVTAA
jgi:hypothetical protein